MNVEDKLAACLLRVRGRLPFFGTLALFAEHRLDESIPTAATDGRTVLFNSKFALSLKPSELDGVMVHELLHAALLHTGRRGDRDPLLWNIAADIVVNGIVRQEEHLRLPGNALVDPQLEGYEVEEVYRILEQDNPTIATDCIGPDLLAGGEKATELSAHWRAALRESATLALAAKGTLPKGMKVHLEGCLQPQLDWRSLLWRFLVRTPTDYGEFDRRLIGQGLYLETLAGENVQVRVCIDTSGSIDPAMLGAFVAELREILRLYPHLDARLYYADAALYGPYDLEEEALARPRGGGGTSFVPFLEKVAKETVCAGESLLVYLTDGYGTFPKDPPGQPVLWVVSPGGLASQHFPFGDVARLGTLK